MKKFTIFPSRAFSHVRLTWRRALESSRVMKSVFIKLILSLTDGLTKEQCIAAHLFWQSCSRLARKSGWLFLALYLKQARVALQRYVSGDSQPELSVYVSLTRCVLPRIIPSFHRAEIRSNMEICAVWTLV